MLLKANANRKSSDEPAHLCSQVRTFSVKICLDQKYVRAQNNIALDRLYHSMVTKSVFSSCCMQIYVNTCITFS